MLARDEVIKIRRGKTTGGGRWKGQKRIGPYELAHSDAEEPANP